jgi:hypothetical protein
MHQARLGLCAVAVNGKIYAIGGNPGNGATGTNEEYDPATDTWTFKSSMPTPRYAFGVAVYQNRIYCFGGKTAGNSAVNVTEVYDSLTDTWQTLQPMPTARMNLQANVVIDKIYLLGGRNTDEVNINNYGLNEVFDPITGTWSTKTPMPQASAVYGCVSAVFNNEIYLITQTQTMIYSPKNDNWSQGTPPPSKHYSIGGITSGMHSSLLIYVFGSDITQTYNPRTDRWSILDSNSSLNYYVSVAVLDDKFYFLGGFFLRPSEPRDGPSVNKFQEEYSGANVEYTPLDYGIPDPAFTNPKITLVSPENITYDASSIQLNFTVDKPIEWIGYCLDSQENVTAVGNSTIADLSDGQHNVTVYADDTFGNKGASQTATFAVAIPEVNFPTPTVAAISGTISIIVVGAGILLYLKKRTCLL